MPVDLSQLPFDPNATWETAPYGYLVPGDAMEGLNEFARQLASLYGLPSNATRDDYTRAMYGYVPPDTTGMSWEQIQQLQKESDQLKAKAQKAANDAFSAWKKANPGYTSAQPGAAAAYQAALAVDPGIASKGYVAPAGSGQGEPATMQPGAWDQYGSFIPTNLMLDYQGSGGSTPTTTPPSITPAQQAYIQANTQKPTPAQQQQLDAFQSLQAQQPSQIAAQQAVYGGNYASAADMLNAIRGYASGAPPAPPQTVTPTTTIPTTTETTATNLPATPYTPAAAATPKISTRIPGFSAPSASSFKVPNLARATQKRWSNFPTTTY